MPDVGILDLQIRDNSSKAYGSLDSLAGALLRVKGATQGAKISSVATQLGKIKTAVDLITQNGAAQQINKLAFAIERLKNASSGFVAPNLNGIVKAQREIENVRNAYNNIGTGTKGTTVTDFTGGLSERKQEVQEAVEDAKGISEQFSQIAETAENAAERVTQATGTIERHHPKYAAQAPYAPQGEMLYNDDPDKLAEMVQRRAAVVEEGFKTVSDKLNFWREKLAGDSERVRNAIALAYKIDPKYLDQQTPQPFTSGTQFTQITPEVQEAKISTEGFVDTLTNAYNRTDLMNMKLEGMRQALIDDVNAERLSTQQIAERAMQIQHLQEQIDSMAESEDEARYTTRDLWELLKERIHNSSIGKLTSQFTRIAKLRAIRAVLRQIVAGFNEGIENVYRYNQAIGGEFATKMDSASSSLLQMKNSIGAAASPLISTMIPYMQQLVSWFITGINYLNQFIALLRGQQTWTRAVPTTAKAFDDVKKSAGGAASAVKDLLADWDELNIIQSESGSGGSGSGTSDMADYLSMFEEVEEYDSTLTRITGFLKDNLEDIEDLAIAAGAAILGWKLSSQFEGGLGKIGNLIGAAATIAITVKMTDILGKEYTKTGETGWLIADALTGGVGSVMAGHLAKQIAGEGAGYVAAGFTLALSGAVNLENSVSAARQGQEAQAQMLNILGSVEAGIGTALAAYGIGLGGPFSLAAGAIVATTAFTITMMINSRLEAERSRIQWGDVSLTEEEIQRYVSGTFFNVDVPMTVQLVSEQVNANRVDKENLEKQLSKTLGTFNVIKLGVSTNEDYSNLKSEVEELINKAHTYVEDARKTGKLTLQFTPELVGSTQGEQKSWYTGYTEGWNTVDQFYSEKGKELGKLLVTNEKGEIEVRQPELLKTIMDQMASVTSTMTMSKINTTALSNLQFGLADLTEESYSGVIDQFESYRNELEKQYDAMMQEQVIMQSQLVAALFEIEGPEGKKYKEAATQLAQMQENMVGLAAEKAAEAAKPGMDLIAEDLKKRLAYSLEKSGSSMQDVPWWNDMLQWNDDLLGNSAEDFAANLNERLFNAMSHLGVPEQFIETADKLGISALEMLSESDLMNVVGKLFSGAMESFEPAQAMRNWLNTSTIAGWFGNESKYLSDFFSPDAVMDVGIVLDESMSDPVDLPPVNTETFASATDAAATAAESMRDRIVAAFASINGLGISASASGLFSGGPGKSMINFMTVQTHAGGGIIRSGDLFSANENGNVEMIGRYGNNTAVANNQQIVDGISQGVSSGQEEQNSLLRRQNEILIQLLNKKFVAQVSPTSSLGRTNELSNDRYKRMRG